jgi:hypothetical protein
MFRLPASIAAWCALAILPGSAEAQPLGDRISLKVDLPGDSPVTLVSVDSEQSTFLVRGSAIVFDVRAHLRLRNDRPQQIRGISLIVLTGGRAPGGRGLVRPPRLNITQGGTFLVHIDLRVCRPVTDPDARRILVSLDAVLFDGLQLYGPDESGSRPWLEARETSALHDRLRLVSTLEHDGVEALRQEILAFLRPTATPSPENRRLADLYRTQGMQALIDELKPF